MNNLVDHVYNQQLKSAKELVNQSHAEKLRYIRATFGALFVLYDNKLTTLEKVEQAIAVLERAIEGEGGEK